jgi:hypothetical protein
MTKAQHLKFHYLNVLSFHVAFLVICIILYARSSMEYGEVFNNET